MSSAQKTLVEDDVLDFESEDFTFSELSFPIYKMGNTMPVSG